jgi:hypothetical protein
VSRKHILRSAFVNGVIVMVALILIATHAHAFTDDQCFAMSKAYGTVAQARDDGVDPSVSESAAANGMIQSGATQADARATAHKVVHSVYFDWSDKSKGEIEQAALVATKNSESGQESRVLRSLDVVSPACLRMCVPSSPSLPAGSVAGRFWNWRTSLFVISCTFFVASGRVGPT